MYHLRLILLALASFPISGSHVCNSTSTNINSTSIYIKVAMSLKITTVCMTRQQVNCLSDVKTDKLYLSQGYGLDKHQAVSYYIIKHAVLPCTTTQTF